VEASRLSRGIARLSAAGYVPEIAEGVLAADGYLAGSDRHRARQIEWAVTLPEARAVMAARGGFGTTRILPLVDWRKAARRRKLLVGFSDLTAVLSFVSTRLSFPCIHGPMAAADLALRFDAFALDAFARLASGSVSPREPWGETLERVRGGAARGVLTGGCLSVITALLGTPHEPDFRGALLFLEDVGEPAYRLDRMLTQWLRSGRWSKIAGIVVGKMAPARGETGEELRRILHAAGAALSVPVWYGFPAGHEGKNIALPFGVGARVDARGRLFLLDSPVEPA
jgi:muramoyltetrapeptide carboxypeptidase